MTLALNMVDAKVLPSRTLASGLLACARAFGTAAEHLENGARVARFLHGQLQFQGRDDDIYVVSYPRSGTTLLQYSVLLLCHLDAIDFEHISEVSPWWERSLAHRGTAVQEFRQLASPRIFKSHLPYGWLPAQGRLVYVYRDVRDVVVSYYHLYRSHLAFQGSFEQFFNAFMDGKLQYGSWFKHVSTWRRQANNPRVLLLRYEDMQHQRFACLRRLADFFAIDASDAHIKRVIKASNFEVMKSLEHKFDHIGEIIRQKGVKPHAFIRQGQVGQGTHELTPEQLSVLARSAEPQAPRRGWDWRLAAFLH